MGDRENKNLEMVRGGMGLRMIMKSEEIHGPCPPRTHRYPLFGEPVPETWREELYEGYGYFLPGIMNSSKNDSQTQSQGAVPENESSTLSEVSLEVDLKPGSSMRVLHQDPGKKEVEDGSCEKEALEPTNPDL